MASITATIETPNGSHWLELNDRSGPEPFKREELYPVLVVEGVPRLGRPVRAQFSADRYLGSVWYENTQKSRDEMGSWRIILREVREVPGAGESYGRMASGVGDVARTLIRDAGEPVIREWLESHEYRPARSRAAAWAVQRALEAPAAHALERMRETLERCAPALEGGRVGKFREAIGLLAAASELVAEATAEEVV